MEINLLLRLILAHLLTDFVLQPQSWVIAKERHQGRSVKLYLHIFITTLVAYLLSGLYSNWVIPMVIFFSHLAIDYIKSKKGKNTFSHFIADQLAHILVIVLLWLSVENKWADIGPFVEQATGKSRFWIIATGYLFVSWPLGIIIGKATQKWRDQISREKEGLVTPPLTISTDLPDDEPATESAAEPVSPPLKSSGEQELGLASAGKWIGICERILILTFVLMGQYTAIGFLMTAKSILRFSEKEVNTQLKTEYVLVGTLVSFASAAMIGVVMNIALN